MIDFSLTNSSQRFGLDIGFQSLKLAQIEKRRGKNILVGAIEIPLKEKILDRDRFKNVADTANLIKDSIKKAKPHAIFAKNIVSALPETFVFSKTLKMPRMSANEYMTAIPNEIAQLLPIPADNMYFDYQILVAHPNESLNDILVVATPKRLVDDFVEMARLADLELVALETKSLAVGRAVIDPTNLEGNMTIHIGTEYSRIGIWDGRDLRLTATVNTGQNQLLESLGYTEPIIGKKTIKMDAEGQKSIAIPLNNIIEESLNAIKYHHNRSYKPKPVKKVFLCGSGVHIEGLDSLIESEIKIKTEIYKLKIDKNEIDPQYVTALGLALRDESE